jgi:hypothetical protein
MSDWDDNSKAEEQLVGRRVKDKFAGLDAFIPPARPFAELEREAGMSRIESTRRMVPVSPTPRVRGNAGASLALVGIAAVAVLILGSGIWGLRHDMAPAASPSPTIATSAAASPSASATGTPMPIPSRGQPIVSGHPTTIFSEIGWAASWSPAGTRIAFSTADGQSPQPTRIVDTTGRTLETVSAMFFMWVDDDTYLGFTLQSDYLSYHAFVGHVGSSVRESLEGSYYMDPIGNAVGAAGWLALPVDLNQDSYVVWSANGLSQPRSGTPVGISRDGKLTAVMHANPSRLALVRTDSGDEVASYAQPANSSQHMLFFGFSPDGSRVAFSPDDRYTSLSILDAGSNRTSVVDPCAAVGAVWLDDIDLFANSFTPCATAAGSGVTITHATTATGAALAVSSTGRVAWLAASPDPAVAASSFEIAIDDGAGGRQMIRFQGRTQDLRVTWSPDGSLLLIEYVGPGTTNPNSYVALIQP